MATDHFPTFRNLDRRLRAVRWRSWFPLRASGAWFPTFAPWFWSFLGRGGVTVAQRRALLRLIQVAAEEQIPLAPLVAAWAEDEPLMQRNRLTKLSQALAAGLPVADAVERFPALLSDEEILLVRFASESGTLAASLRRHLKEATDAAAPIRNNLRRSKSYLLMMLCIGVPIALWVQFYIDPALEQIEGHFLITDSLAQRLRAMRYNLYNQLAPTGMGLLAIYLAGRWLKGPWRRFQRRFAPFFFRSVGNQRVAHVLRRLGESSAAGRPLAGAVSTLARRHYDPALRHKLLFARNELALGAELWPSFQSVGLLSAEESRALTLGEPLGVTAWTLAAIADAKERRALRRQTWLSSCLAWAVVLLFGAFVLTQAISMFAFLSGVITNFV